LLPFELPGGEAAAVQVKLVEIAAAAVTVTSELDLELHLVLAHGQLTDRAGRIHPRPTPHTVRWSRRELALAHDLSGFFAKGSFIRHMADSNGTAVGTKPDARGRDASRVNQTARWKAPSL
jgi:hypothetical protein